MTTKSVLFACRDQILYLIKYLIRDLLILFLSSLGVDFHFFLRDNDGHWSHKPGETSVTRTDNSGNLINDPSAAGVDMNGYVFHCFMTTNRNTVNIL